MDKEFFFNEGAYASAPQTTWNQLQLGSRIYNQNWEISMDQSDPFESALSSIVSSPVASSAMNGGGGDNFMIREVIGRLGSICNSGEISPHSYIGGSSSTSCYNTPLNSPPKLNLSLGDPQVRAYIQPSGHHLPSPPNISPSSADPGFAERAARFSCFNNTPSSNGQMGLKEAEMAVRSISRVGSGKFSRVSGNRPKSGGQEGRDENPILKKFNWFSTSSTAENPEPREGSTLTEQNPEGKSRAKIKGENNSRKRRSIPKGEAKEPRRNRQNEASGNEKDASKVKAEPGGDIKEEEDGNPKQIENAEPPKDYIHVRARRGQATDSHSLAERVRREKISQRMKFLQDLVPGCNKVTGKAVMLDEIISYVQSLQHQVEFLSMKLATLNPRMDATMEDGLLPPFSSCYQSLQLQTINGNVSSGTELNLPTNYYLDGAFRRNNPHAGYGESSHQASEFWADDLQSVVQMSYDPSQQKHFHGSMAETQMKAEL